MPIVRAATTGDLDAVVALWDLGAVSVDAMVHAGSDGAIGFWRAAGCSVEGDDRRWSIVPGDAGPDASMSAAGR